MAPDTARPATKGAANPVSSTWTNRTELTPIPGLVGTLELRWINARSLQNNPMGDPWVRPILTLTPSPGDAQPFRTLYVLHGSTVGIETWFDNHGETIRTIDRINTELADPYLVVFPDAQTSVGGSQYFDSPAIGNYLTYITTDVVDHIDSTLPTIRSREARAIIGHSSGGLGAFNAATHHTQRFSRLGMMSADAMFEGVHLSSALAATRRQGATETADIGSELHQDHAIADQIMLAYAYSAVASPQFLVDPTTGLSDQPTWQRWLTFDPVRRVDFCHQELRQLHRIHLAAGTADPTYSDLGARALMLAMQRHNIAASLNLTATDHSIRGTLQQCVKAIITDLV